MNFFLNRLRNMSKSQRLISFSLVMTIFLLGYLFYRSWLSTQQLIDVIEPPPCWSQLCPEQSTREDAISFLLSLPEIENKNIHDNSNAGENQTRWWFTHKLGGGSGTIIYDQTDTISYITIDFPQRNSSSLEFIFEEFGEPEQIFAVLGCADSQWVQVWLLYPQIGFGVEIFEPNIGKTNIVKLSLEQDIAGIVYYPEYNYEDVLLSSDGIFSYQKIDEIQDFVMPWLGIEREVVYLNTCK